MGITQTYGYQSNIYEYQSGILVSHLSMSMTGILSITVMYEYILEILESL